MSEVSLLDALAAWYDNHLQAALSADAQMTLGRTNDGRSKHSAWVEMEHHGRLGELIVWDSGEAEYMTGGEIDPMTNEHHEIGSRAQLELLLDRLFSTVIR